ncbi:putative membrane protein [Vibrio parahaemolyticus NIHCB0757]|nr:putative membrane protein [Vibrio parahaemolyticus 10290]EQM39836.1 putative membrane protein [Vibrio parahaemolyticus NIHCB0757]
MTIGGVVHLYDNIVDGFLPYDFAPRWLNIYWSALGLLDLLAVYLLVKHRRVGLVLMLLILMTNVIFSSHAHYTLEILDNNVALQMKTLFLGFSLGVSIWLWNARKHQQSRQIFR